MKIDLSKLEPNPARDFKVDPVDDEVVAKLRASIKDSGFWGGTTARRHPTKPGHFQTGGGEHRIRAALLEGVMQAEIFVGEFDDDQMLDLYYTENATQRGNHSPAVAGVVASAIRMLARRDFAVEAIAAETGGNSRGNKKQGVGRDRIVEYFETRKMRGLAKKVIEQQIAILKDSGDYDRILDEEIKVAEARYAAQLEAARKAEEARLAKERAEEEAAQRLEAAKAEAARKREEAARAKAEREEAEAKARKAKEAAKREEETRKKAEAERRAKEAEADAAKARAAEERRKADERRAKEETAKAQAASKTAQDEVTAAIRDAEKHAAANAAKAKIDCERAREKEAHPIFDYAGVSKVLTVPAHIEAFREAVTDEIRKKILPVDQQAYLAKEIVIFASKIKDGLSARLIRELVVMHSRHPQNINRKIEQEERARFDPRDWDSKMSELQSEFLSKAAGHVKLFTKRILEHHKERPPGATFHSTAKFEASLADLIEAVETIRETLGITSKMTSRERSRALEDKLFHKGATINH